MRRGRRCLGCNREWMKAYRDARPGMMARYGKDWVESLNRRVYELLGARCSDCPCEDRELLTVDHVNNDRQSERDPGSHSWKQDLLAGKRPLSDYAVRCRNCNEARQRKNPTQLRKERTPIGVMKTCSMCSLTKDVSEFNGRGGNQRSECAQCTRSTNWNKTTSVYALLGGSCRCCGESDPYKMNIDHVNDDGASRRKVDGLGSTLCRRILNGTVPASGFQLLCANCNYSKMLRGGTCIHASYEAGVEA